MNIQEVYKFIDETQTTRRLTEDEAIFFYEESQELLKGRKSHGWAATIRRQEERQRKS